jgi:hypothetical protein
LSYDQYLQEYFYFADIENNETTRSIFFSLVGELGIIVDDPQEPHGDSSPCRALPQTIDPRDLGVFSSFLSFQFNSLPDSHGDSQPLCNEPLEAVSPWNPDGAFLSQLDLFPFYQWTREEDTYESLPRRQLSDPLRRSLPVPPINNATSPQPTQ